MQTYARFFLKEIIGSNFEVSLFVLFMCPDTIKAFSKKGFYIYKKELKLSQVYNFGLGIFFFIESKRFIGKGNT
jgi:hypothetical protein